MKHIAMVVCLFLCLAGGSSLAETQTGVTSWGLDRVDQRLGIDSAYTYDYNGSNTIIYIVDKGVSDVDDLAGRIIEHRHFTFSGPDDLYTPTSPVNEHGTKAASIAAGTTYGVAKGARIVDLRVYSYGTNGSGQAVFNTGCLTDTGESINCTVAAFHYIAATHPAAYRGVVNFSGTMGSKPASAEFRDAILALMGRGITVVVSATEHGCNACNQTPSDLGETYNGLITVSAVERDATYFDDRLAVDEVPEPDMEAGSGPCVDIFAPSSTLAANYKTGTPDPDIFMHTSSATAFVSGAAALVYSQSPWMMPNDVEDLLKENATRNVLVNIPGNTVNALLYTRLPVVNVNPPSAGTRQNVTASVTPIAGATYLWSIANSNGTIVGSNTGPSVTVTTGCPNLTILKVKITTSDGRSFSGYGSIQITPATASVSGSASINAGQSATVNLAFTGTGPWLVTWSDGLQQTYTASSATRSVTPSQTMNYRVLNVRDGNSCNGTTTGYAPVTVCPVSTTITAPAGGKASQAVSVSVPATSGATYQWTVTNGLLWNGGTTTSPTIILGCSGTTTVTVRVTTSCGAQSIASKSIPITLPSVLVWNSSTIPAGETAIVAASFSGTPPFSIWFSDGMQVTSINSYTYYYYVTPSVTTTYTATAMSSKYGCAGTTSGSATVTVE